MEHSPLSITDLRNKIHEGEVKDPLVFLESVMNGQDPRRLSELYQLVVDIDDFSDGIISKEDWNEVVSKVISTCKFHIVSLSESTAAAKTLAEYLHAKRKHIEKSTSDGTGGDGSTEPLTEEEILMFKEVFEDDF